MSEQLRSVFTRWLALELHKAEISDDLKELFAEAKGNGFDPKALRLAFRTKVKDSEPLSEADKNTAALVETYLVALEERPSRASAPARVEIIEETATNTSGESRERQKPETPAVMLASEGSKPEAPPMDEARKGPSGTAATDEEDLPTFLQCGHPDNAWAVREPRATGR